MGLINSLNIKVYNTVINGKLTKTLASTRKPDVVIENKERIKIFLSHNYIRGKILFILIINITNHDNNSTTLIVER